MIQASGDSVFGPVELDCIDMPEVDCGCKGEIKGDSKVFGLSN